MPQSALDWMAGPAIPLSMPAWAGALPLGNFGDPGTLHLGDAARGGVGGLSLGEAATTRYTDPLAIVFNTPKLEKARREEAEQKAEGRRQRQNARQVGAQARGVAAVAPGAPIDYSSREAYLRTAMPYFQQIEAKTGIPAESLAAISIQEGVTVPGTLANRSGAPFGIKSVGRDASGNDIHTGYPVTYIPNAWEVDAQGRNTTQPSYFINFPDPQSAIQGFVDFLQRNERYRSALQAASRGTTPQEFNALLAQAGYATDPNWTRAINSIAGEAAQYRRAAPAAEAPAYPVTPDAWPAALSTPFSGAPYRIAFDVHQRYTTPLPGGTTHHRGVDLVPTEGGIGAPVTALAGGRVVAFRQGGAQGNAVVLQAADGLYHAYFHLLDPNTLAEGTIIQPGQQIGRMGQSGSEGFPHLHLEVRRNLNGDPRGAVIDPLAYFGLR